MLLGRSRLAPCVGDLRFDHFSGAARVGDDGAEHVVKLMHGVRLENMRLDVRGNVFNDIVLGIVEPGPGRRLRVVPAIGNGRVGARHFQRRNRRRAEGQGQHRVQMGMNAHHAGVANGRLRADEMQHFDGDDIYRIRRRFAQVHITVGIPGVVFRCVRAVAGAKRRSDIQHRSAFFHGAVIDGRRIDDGFKRRAGLAAMHGVVDLRLLVVRTADHRFDLAGLRV